MQKELKNDLIKIKILHEQISISHLILPSHILLSLFLLYHNDSGSRYSISNYLALPMTRVRKLLDLLEENKLVIKNKGRRGSILTEEGFNVCQTIFSYFKVVNPEESIDLGEIVLGKVTSVIVMDKEFFTEQINTISVRDSSLKCGALGASIFETYLDQDATLKVKFLEDTDYSDPKIALEFDKVTLKLTEALDLEAHKLIIASTINDLPKYYFNPLFDSKTVEPFKVVLLASVQSMWELIERELS